MQTSLVFPTPDNHKIYGTLDQKGEKKDKIIIFCHGLTGSPNEVQFALAPDFFGPKGYDVFRFAFYTAKPDARQLSECTIQTHSRDLEIVLNYFRPLYQEIVLIGHSLGALAILGADTSAVEHIIYWDPSRGTPDLEKRNIFYIPSLDKYLLKRGKETLISKEMAGEMVETSKNLEQISKKVSKNSSFVFAENYSIYEIRKPFVTDFPVKVISGASHTFCEEGKIGKLYDATWELLQNTK